MSFNMRIHWSLGDVRNMALHVSAVLAFVGMSAVGAKTDLICVVELNSAEQLISSIDTTFLPLDSPSCNASGGACGCETGAAKIGPFNPSSPFLPIVFLLNEVPLNGLITPSQSGGAGSNSSGANGPSNASVFVSFSTVIDVSNFLLSGHVCGGADEKIPVALSSRLFRPPREV